jgi:hypothetical protein
MTEHAFEIDDAPLFPQPTEYEWEYGDALVVGRDGLGAPIKRKYGSCRLRVSGRALNLNNVNWFDFDDGSTHTATLIEPEIGRVWSDYSSVYCTVTPGGAETGGAVSSLEMVISMVDLS